MTESAFNYHRVLLVEDDARLASLIQEYMQGHGFEVAIESHGDAAVERIAEEQPDVVILDWMLPGMDGLEICRRAREHYRGAILMLTARDEDVDQIVGLEVGADDYVTKPVEPRVLLARVKALLRRVQPGEEERNGDDLTIGPLYISAVSRQAKLQGEAIKMTTAEFDLLWYLASRAGSIVTRDQLYSDLCGIEYDGIDRSIDIRVSRLRKLIGDDSEQPRCIKTIRGKGYLFADERGGS